MEKRSPISRRSFLEVAIGSVVVAGVGCSSEEDGDASDTGGAEAGSSGTGGRGGTGGTTGGRQAGGGAETGGNGTGGTTGDQPLVALVRRTDAIQATQDAIAAMGGFPDLTGQQVMLRPNAIDVAPPGSVNPDVIRGVIRAILAAGTPAGIVVADDTFTGATLDRMERNGIRAAAEAEGATCVGLEGGPTTDARPAGVEEWPGDGIPFYDAVRDADYVVNIPVCKTHGVTRFSMALKAWYGNVPGGARSHSHSNVTLISNALAEMHLVRKEDFVVLDATSCLLSGGPQVGSAADVANPEIVVASRDPILADVTGLCILRHYIEQTQTDNWTLTSNGVWEHPQIVRAMALTALGWVTSKQSYSYSAQGIDEIATIMAYRE
ncbi:MAG: DUF362 domain-containing protein [Polyangiaceae bacterium]|nr:DUF362 domain-containing protein [Polyangiaceae bacterium]